MRVGNSNAMYEWVDDWAKIPDTQSAREGWAHHGIVVSQSGNIVAFHQSDPTVLIFDRNGNLERSWDIGLKEAHGMTLVNDLESEYLWMSDNISGKVLKTTLQGTIVMSLADPDIPVYISGKYAPTDVLVNEEMHGGNGDIWVADGYGENYVHRYDKDGNYLNSINGEEGSAGAFNCPHGIWIDRRKHDAELYVADRGNQRVQVYDLEGRFKRVFGEGYLSSPSAFVSDDNRLIVAELNARLAVLDLDDNLVCYLGDNENITEVDGWPNVSPEFIEPGKFNSPHGIAADEDGNIYVAEWLIGGRITKLAKIC